MIQANFGLNWPSGFRGEDFSQFLGNNSKTVNKNRILTWDRNDQHSKIYLPCNFEVNLITRIGVIALFSSNF
jgi:hypothetical protein